MVRKHAKCCQKSFIYKSEPCDSLASFLDRPLSLTIKSGQESFQAHWFNTAIRWAAIAAVDKIENRNVALGEKKSSSSVMLVFEPQL